MRGLLGLGSVRRRFVGSVSGAILVTGAGMSPIAVTPAHAGSNDICADNTYLTLNCSNVYLPSLYSLNVTAADSYATLSSHNDASRYWAFIPDTSDGTLRFINKRFGTCLTSPHPPRWTFNGPTWQESCGKPLWPSLQKWYLQPVKGIDGYAPAYMIRNEFSGKCLDATGARYEDGTVIRADDCHGGENQQWIFNAIRALPNQSTGEQVLKTLAIEHAVKQCQKDTHFCDWTQENLTPDVKYGPKYCFAGPWYNDQTGTGGSQDEGRVLVTEETVKGTRDSITNSLEVSAEGSPFGGLFGKVAAKYTLSQTHEWSTSNSRSVSHWVPTPPGMWTWVEASQKVRDVTGEWTFDVNGKFPWKVHKTIALPVVDSWPATERKSEPTRSGIC
ncbi:RICIN domain-containing protein [Streptomyces sp. MS06]|uniref:RICIN domain-containing protein n=1 Tax=Streptomyces sp. MS06 TaxID=3385974 RepID=UPI0039A29821